MRENYVQIGRGWFLILILLAVMLVISYAPINPWATAHMDCTAEEGANQKSDEDVNIGDKAPLDPRLSFPKDNLDQDSNKKNKMTEPKTKTAQGWLKLRRTMQINTAIQKKAPLNRADSFLEKFSTLQLPENIETVESISGSVASENTSNQVRRRKTKVLRTVVNPEKNFYYYWHWLLSLCVMYNLWAIIVRHSFHELQNLYQTFWIICDIAVDIVFVLDIVVQFRTSYLEQGLMVYNSKKLAMHYLKSRSFIFDFLALIPLELIQIKIGIYPIVRIHRLFKCYRAINWYYMVESRTSYPNVWRVVNLVHVLLFLTHWFGCFYYMISKIDRYQNSTNTTHSDWTYPLHSNPKAPLSRQYLGSIYWSTLTLTTIGDLPMPQKNIEEDGASKFLAPNGRKSRLLLLNTNTGFVFTIMSYLIGVFIFATIVGQVGSVITNRNANRLEYERLLDSAKAYMRHHKVPSRMKRRVIRWYDYSWSRGRIHGGDQLNNALGHLPIKLKTDLALHINLRVLKKVTIFQECQPQFLHDLVLKMRAYVFTPGDAVCRRGDIAREMFIIVDGVLKVIAENGKVLTVMESGDFFGEIGILNLDGLNKRTADVISVGYSELFSLSREDVLTALNDYPEAYEKLQDLGKKRLQEAKKITRQKSKPFMSPDNSSGEDNGHKKLLPTRLDVKSIRNQIRNRSRHKHRGSSSLELPSTQGKMVQKMPRGKSDESPPNYAEVEDNNEDTLQINKGESIIGAGLPLLARLKLLKELQNTKEQGTNQPQIPLTAMTLPTQNHQLTSTSSEGNNLQFLQKLFLPKSKEKTNSCGDQLLHSGPINLSSLKNPLSSTINTVNISQRKSEAISSDKLTNHSIKLIRKTSSPCESHSKSRVTFNDNIQQNKSNSITIPQVTEVMDQTINNFIPCSTATVMLSDLRNCIKPNDKSNIANISKELPKARTIETSLLMNNIQAPNICKETLNFTNNECDNIKRNQQNIIESLKTVQNKLFDLKTLDKNIYSFKAVDLAKQSEVTYLTDSVNTQKSKSTDNLSVNSDSEGDTELKTILYLRSSSLNNITSSVICQSKNPMRSYSEDSVYICKKQLTRQITKFRKVNESNETLERQTLKSILKNISNTVISRESREKQQHRETLLQEPTLKGYAARHSKFAKNVSCPRQIFQHLKTPKIKNVDNICKIIESYTECVPSLHDKNIGFEKGHLKSTQFKQSLDDLKNNSSNSDVNTLYTSSVGSKTIYNKEVKSIEITIQELTVIKLAIQNYLHNLQTKSCARCLLKQIQQPDEFICKLLVQIQKLEDFSRPSQEKRVGDECRDRTTSELWTQSDSDKNNVSSYGTGYVCEESNLSRIEKNSSDDDGKKVKHFQYIRASSHKDIAHDNIKEFTKDIEDNATYSEIFPEILTNDKNTWQSTKVDSNEIGLQTEDTDLSRRKSWSSLTKQDNVDVMKSPLLFYTKPISNEPTSKYGSDTSSILKKPIIKKTLSVDAGIHHTRLSRKTSVSPKHRKFSLGSLFGQGRRSNNKQDKSTNDVIIDICNDRNQLNKTPTSPSGSWNIECRASSSRRDSIASYNAYSKNVSNWEVLMLAEELENIEQGQLEKVNQNNATALKDFEEELDSQSDGSGNESSDIEAFNPSTIINFLSDPNSVPHKFFEVSSSNKREKKIDEMRRQHRSVARTASLDSESCTNFGLTKRFHSFNYSRTD